ncbi:MAG TPA: hypothetical protein VGR35_21155 [Tepidisphaeraceae bacterium]|nr:hypothetical protein [Tepidisphaeraceae bacterium]
MRLALQKFRPLRLNARANPCCRRRGATAVLAMLYLVLFSTLALGFYAATTTAVQVSHNEEKASRAFLASESGMDFMRYHLARVSIPPFAPATSVTTELANDLKERLENTGNMPGLTVAASGNVINIPAEPNAYIKLDPAGNAGFRATITDWPDQGKVVMKVTGRYGSTTLTRAIQMDYTRVPKEPTIFDFAVASKGQIVMKKHEVTSLDPANALQAKMLSALNAQPSILVTGGAIGGKLTILDTASVVVTGGSVAGETNAAAIVADTTLRAVPADELPAFPTFDTTVYSGFATRTSTGAAGNTVLKNVRIPAGTNPQFNGDATLQGIMYIESPNTVTINGSMNLQGFIVFEGEGDTAVNNLVISGNLSTGPLPSSSEFDSMRAATGVSILAPTSTVKVTGSARGTLRGNVITGQFATSGTFATLIIDHGTLVTLEETPNSAVFDGKTIKFNGTGANNLPKLGMGFEAIYHPEPESYQELLP